MTIKYECDRCHVQSEHIIDWLKVMTDRELKTLGFQYPHTFHYCPKCAVIMMNAIAITNNGTYDGRVKE